ncbi:MAG: hypothetical protein QNJ45_24330 [Ardenticatenaceae bacterium]|nr:hypothetical protein [Ardenticatenaceae bacterium]
MSKKGHSSPPKYQLTPQDRFNGTFLWSLCELARYTCRFSVTGWEQVWAEHEAQRTVIFGTWHANSMMLVAYMRRWVKSLDITAIVPDDWRGGALVEWLIHSDITPWPLDLENKGIGTARRLVELVRFMRTEKYDTYISPDGPEGPSRVIKPGATFLAQKTGSVILPIAAECRPGHTVYRWDGYRVPLPFGRIHIATGPAIRISRGDDLDDANEQLRRALNDVQLQARDELYSRQMPLIDPDFVG